MRYFLLLVSVLMVACDADRQGPVSSMNDVPSKITVSKADAMDTAKPNKPTVKKYPLATVSMELTKVSEHVYYARGKAGMATENQGFVSNSGVIITDEGVILYDALGTPSLAELLLEKIRQITDKPVVKVIVSHYHADHIYGLQVFKDLGAEIIASEGAQKYLDSEVAQERLEERKFSLDPWVNEQTRLVSPDQYIKQGVKFSLGGVEFITNVVGEAHSDADMTLYVATDRVLLSGDIIFEGRVAYLGDANTRNWLEILEQIEQEGLVALIPGHGRAAIDPNNAIKLTRRYLAFMREHIGKAVEEMIDFEDVYKNTDWSEFEKLPAFEAVNRKNAYQVYLAMEREELEKE